MYRATFANIIFMPDIIEDKIIPFLKKTLPAERMKHVLGVMALSEKLATRHGLSRPRAKLAAALHDIARCWDKNKLIEYAQARRLKVPDKKFVCKVQPVLLHSYVGADLARRMFHVRDRQILAAISKHSFASLKMNAFEKVIYLADLVAPDRNFPEIYSLRILAFKDLDRAFVGGLRAKMVYLLRTNDLIHPSAVPVWNYFVQRLS